MDVSTTVLSPRPDAAADEGAGRVIVRVDLAAVAAAAAAASATAVGAAAPGKAAAAAAARPLSVSVGDVISGKITVVLPLQANLRLARGAVGRVHATAAAAGTQRLFAAYVVALPDEPVSADGGRPALGALTVDAALRVRVVGK